MPPSLKIRLHALRMHAGSGHLGTKTTRQVQWPGGFLEPVTLTREVWMSNRLIAGLAALFISASSLAYAQAPAAAKQLLSATELKGLTDRRIEVIKTVLALTSDQEKYWPAVEEAIRARATARHLRLERLAALRSGEQHVGDPIELLRMRADALAERAAGLKKLADAWQPLYETLDTNQKARMRLLAVVVLREMRDAAESRRMQSEDEDEAED
jgi:LTXXQ motif family protein